MQFKHPEILYFLALLIIPIIVHLFQLQRFVKVPFTNVAFLQKLALQTRKSSQLKKWLILTTRTLGLLAIILSFSQPYFSSKKEGEKQNNFIYLDNSLSTNSKGEKGNLLQVAIQDVIEHISNEDNFSLLTNNNFYKELSASELKKVLLNTKNEAKKVNLNAILLKLNTKKQNSINTSLKNILISDFQNTYINNFTNVNSNLSLIKLKNNTLNNISIDSVSLTTNNNSSFTVNATIKNQGEEKNNIPIALFNKNKLVSKLSFSIEKNSKKIISFIIREKADFLGKIHVTFSDTFPFDNSFYFTKKSANKINVLSIGKSTSFLGKIYSKKEFNFTTSTLQNVNYNKIEKQQLIILNEIENIPSSLINSLLDFSNKGGDIVIIPNQEINTKAYNMFFKILGIGKIIQKNNTPLKITKINFNHPLLKDVFLKKITNFQYPTVNNHYITSLKNTSSIISYNNNSSFLQQINLKNSKLYWFANSLNKRTSNFINSPLVVPVFYNFGQNSLQYSKPYYRIDERNAIDIETQLAKDAVLTIKNNTNSFIPLQQTYQNKVNLITKEQPLDVGFYHIMNKNDTLNTIAFNYPKEESLLNFLDTNQLKNKKNITISNSTSDFFKELNKKNKVRWLWKWFLALAIVSLLLEILILKFLKP